MNDNNDPKRFSNGASHQAPLMLEDLKTWAIAYVSHGEGFVGHILEERGLTDPPVDPPYSVKLSPAWSLVGGTQLNFSQQGQLLGASRAIAVTPIEFLVDERSIEVRPISLLRFGKLRPGDFKFIGDRILQGVHQAEEMRKHASAQRLNLVVPGPGMHLPPMPGAGSKRG